MHIHGSFGIQSANLYSAANSERAAAAQRAEETRKKLLRKAQEIGGESSPEETLLIGQWLDARHSQVLSGDEYHTAASGKNSEFD